MAEDWFYMSGEEPVGPVTAEEIGRLLERNVLGPETWVARAGQSWVLIKDSPLAAVALKPEGLWYFLEGSQTRGPVAADILRAAIGRGQLSPDDVIAPAGGQWLKVKDSPWADSVPKALTPVALAEAQAQAAAEVPKAAPENASFPVTILATLPLWAVLLYTLLPGPLWVLAAFWVLSLGALFSDRKALATQEEDAPEWFWFLVPGVYLYKRAALKEQPPKWAQIWVACAVVHGLYLVVTRALS